MKGGIFFPGKGLSTITPLTLDASNPVVINSLLVTTK